MLMLKSKSIGYDDVNLIAQPQSDIISRSEIKLDKNRIFISPMSFLVGGTFARKALNAGYSVCLHRFHKNEYNQIKIFKNLLLEENRDRLWVTVGKNTSLNFIREIYNSGCENILLDIASGYLTKIIDEFFDKLKICPFKRVGVGNIQSDSILPYYYSKLQENPFIKELYVRCGIGGGNLCLSTPNTGYGRGPITEIDECSSWAKFTKNNEQKIYILADGGVNTSGKAVKAFGAGADCIMTASYWKNCKDAETHILNEHMAYGGASSLQLNKLGIQNKHSEGKVEKVSGQLFDFDYLEVELIGGIKSGISYSGYDSLERFIGNGVFEIKK